MTVLQGPPRPQKTGNAQVDSYLNVLYQWSYQLWYWQTNAGTDAGLDAAKTAARIPWMDGEPGEEGPQGFPGATGPQGLAGLTIPGMDGQDGEDALPSGFGSGNPIYCSTLEASATSRVGAYLVANLPAAGRIGRIACVTDALAPAFLTVVVGGGAVVSPVFDNGANWVVI